MKTSDSVYLEILQNNTEPILYEESDWFVLFAKDTSNEGHLLLISKLKTTEFYNLPKVTLRRGFEIATILAKLLKDTYAPPRVALFIKGFANSDHAHIHITPIFHSEDMDKGSIRHQLTIPEMEVLAIKLKPLITAAMQ